MKDTSKHLSLLNQFRESPQESARSQQVTFRLTPQLVLASALLHMMASDGKIEDAESSQLQSVLGGDQHVIDVAVEYTQTVPIQQFLIDALQVLDKTSTLCVLTNVFDSMLSDGQAGSQELALFDRMKLAWGVETAAFAPFQNAIGLKNNLSVMGPYEANRLNDPVITTHLALAASLLYMMAADGTIATQEIGQLQTVIGRFPGLQEAALKQVRSVKLPEFLKLASPSLSPEGKLFILANVCDSMMADGTVDALESKIFQTMLAGYGHNNTSFKPFYQSIKVKNIKTFSASVHKPKLIYNNMTAGNGLDDEGVRFNRDNSFNEETPASAEDDPSTKPKGPVISHVLADQEGVHAGNRTMQDNIDKVSQGFGDDDQVQVVQNNALADHLALAARAEDADDNIQRIAGKTSNDNLQSIQPGQADLADGIGIPTQSWADESPDLSKQGLTDSHVALDTHSTSPNVAKRSGAIDNDNTIPLIGSANDPHLASLPTEEVKPNIQSLDREALTTNRQAAPESLPTENRQALTSAALEDQKSSLAKAPLVDNRQAVTETAKTPNRQPVAQDAAKSNHNNAAVQTIGTHRAQLPAVSPALKIGLQAHSQPATTRLRTGVQKPSTPKVNRVKELSEHVKQLRLRLDQLAGMNHAVLQAAQNAAGGNCSTCGNPRCLFTHHIH